MRLSVRAFGVRSSFYTLRAGCHGQAAHGRAGLKPGTGPGCARWRTPKLRLSVAPGGGDRIALGPGRLVGTRAERRPGPYLLRRRGRCAVVVQFSRPIRGVQPRRHDQRDDGAAPGSPLQDEHADASLERRTRHSRGAFSRPQGSPTLRLQETPCPVLSHVVE